MAVSPGIAFVRSALLYLRAIATTFFLYAAGD